MLLIQCNHYFEKPYRFLHSWFYEAFNFILFLLFWVEALPKKLKKETVV